MINRGLKRETPPEVVASLRCDAEGPGACGTWGNRAGKVRPMILLWALGVPLPLILIIVLIRGCVG